jgi:hypothetical protein
MSAMGEKLPFVDRAALPLTLGNMEQRSLAGEDFTQDAVRWRVGRTRFALFLPIGLLLCAFAVFLLVNRQLIALVPLALFLLLTAWSVAGLIWPPELAVSVTGLRYSKWGKARSFKWSDLDGPSPGPTFASGKTLMLTVKSTGEQVSLGPSLFDCTYAELADIMNDAKAGRLTTSGMWRRSHQRFWF